MKYGKFMKLLPHGPSYETYLDMSSASYVNNKLFNSNDKSSLEKSVNVLPHTIFYTNVAYNTQKAF